jgi:cytochrome P450
MIGTSRSRHEDGGVVHPRPPSIPAFEEALTDGSFATDPYPWHEVLRTQAPLYYSATLGQWLATSYDLVEEVLLSIDKFSSFGFDSELVARLPDDTIELAPTLAHHYSVRGLVQSDPPEHTRMRRAVRSYFSAQAVRRLEDRISANARRLLESVPDDFDLVRDFAAPLPISMIADLIGVPESEREGFPRWSAEMIQFSGSIRADPEIALRLDRSLIEFRGLLSRLFEERRADPRDDFLSLVTTLVSDGTLTSDEAMFMCVHLLNAGHETTTGLNESEPTVRLARPQRA